MTKKMLCKFILISILMVILAYTTTGNAKATDTTRFSMSYLYGNYDYDELVERTGNSLNEVSPSYFDLHTSGNLKLNPVDTEFVENMHKKGIKVVPFLSNHWDKETGRNALNNMEKLTTQIAEAIQKYDLDGINVDIENVTEKDKENYVLLVKMLRQKLGANKSISVAVAANPYNWQTGWHGSYDYAALAEYADYLMIMTYDEHYESGPAGAVASIDFVEKSIQYALERVSSEKIVLGIPFFGRYWQNGSSYGGYGVSLTQIESILKNYENVVKYDEKTESVYATITIESWEKKPVINGKTLYAGTYTFWYENEKSISAKLDLVNKYNLKGAGSWSLGQETADTWSYFNNKLNEGFVPENGDKPSEGSNSETGNNLGEGTNSETGNNLGDGTNSGVANESSEALLEASKWAEAAITYVKNNGLMKGRTETDFYPKSNLTRAEFATILVRALTLNSSNLNSNSTYLDINGHWAESNILQVTDSGYMQGYPGGDFKPEKNITREEVATVLLKMKENGIIAKGKMDNNGSEGPIFNDIKSEDWSFKAIMEMAQIGIIKGYENGNFEPKKAIKREEMAVILERVFNAIGKSYFPLH